MIRWFAFLLVLLIQLAARAADMSLVNCGDFTGSPTLEYVSSRPHADTTGLHYNPINRGGSIDTIIRGGVEYRVTAKVNNASDPPRRIDVFVSKNRGKWKPYRTGQLVTSTDPHYACVIAIDNDGYLHLCYDMWSTALKYRRSDTPVESWTGTLTAEQSLGISSETAVGYPFFARGRNGNGFYVFCRIGNADLGDIYARTWNGSSWDAMAGTSTGGLLIDGTLNNTPYISAPQFSDDWDGSGTGYMHFCWAWYDDGDDANSKVSHVRWNGSTFSQMGGSQTVPITSANCEVVEDVAEGNILRSIASAAVADDGTPHVLYTYGATNQSIYHAYYSSGWQINTVTTGTGTTAYDGYPNIVVKSDGTAVVVYLDKSDNYAKYRTASSPYSSWSSATTIQSTAIAESAFGFAYDRYQWDENEDFVFLAPYAVAAPFMTNGLVYYLPLDASGVRVEMMRAANFADSGTVGTGTAKVGAFAGDFEFSSSDSITRSIETDNRITGPLTIGAWVQIESTGAFRTIAARANATGSQSCYKLDYDNTNSRYRFQVSADGSTLVNTLANTFGAPGTATYHFVVGTYDGSNINVSVNAGTQDATAHSTGVYNSASADFRIGATSTPNNYWDGLIDEVFLYNRALSTTEISYLYNGGSGRGFDDLHIVAPTIYSHGATASVDVDAGDTAVATVRAYGDLTMGEALSGTDAADFGVTDNGDGTWSLAFAAPATAGTYSVTLTLDNAAGSDATDFTVNVAGTGNGLLRTIILLSQFDRLNKQQSHFDRYGVYSISP